jgi:hypothetical protein
MLFNGLVRIRPGTVFDMEEPESGKLPRGVSLHRGEEAPVVNLGKRERPPGT